LESASAALSAIERFEGAIAMKRAQRQTPKPQRRQQQSGPPPERPQSPAESYGPLDDIIEITRRGYACTACIETKYPPDVDLGPALAGLRGQLRLYFTLDHAAKPFDLATSGKAIGDGILALYETIDRIAPAAQTPPGIVSFSSDLLLAGGRGLPIMASMGPGLPGLPGFPGATLPVSDLIPLLEALVMELEEAANVLPGSAAQQARALVENLQQILRMLRSMAAGATLSLSSVAQMLRHILPRIMELLRAGLTGARFRLVLQAVLRFAYGIAALIPETGGAGAVVAGGGGAAGGAAAGGGAGVAAAAATAFAQVIACVLAFGLGCLIGWLIGNIKIGDKTIHEWLGDCFYWLFWAPSGGCDFAYAQFVRFQSAAEAVRDLGDGDAEIALLATAIAALQQYVALECEEDLDIYRRQIERMEARVRTLLGS
jgi:hypothetical protein